MFKRTWFGLRWALLALLTGSVLLQTTCSTSLATGTAGLLSSVTTEFIRNVVNKALGIESYGSSFGT